MDEPDHTRLRQIVDEAFRRRAVLDMEPRIRAIADDLAGELFADGSPADLVARYARMLPLVGHLRTARPAAGRPAEIHRLGEHGRAARRGHRFRAHDRRPLADETLPGRASAARPRAWRRGPDRRARAGRRWRAGASAPNEMVSMVFLLLGAGSETTTHLISGSVYELLRNPGLRDWLTADWSRGSLAVEEFLRFVSPVQFSKPRFVRRDIELEGVRLKKGDRVMAMVAAANMDPERDRAPRDDSILQRRPNRHISFGTGIHFCLGHQLARLEGICALQALFTRWPGLRLAVEPAAHPLAPAARPAVDRKTAGRGGSTTDTWRQGINPKPPIRISGCLSRGRTALACDILHIHALRAMIPRSKAERLRT